VKFAFVQAEKAHYPVAVLCEVLSVSRSGFYAWTKRKTTKRTSSDARLAIEIRLVELTRFGGQFDYYAANAATCAFNSNSTGLT
jgi:hypothetical protein